MFDLAVKQVIDALNNSCGRNTACRIETAVESLNYPGVDNYTIPKPDTLKLYHDIIGYMHALTTNGTIILQWMTDNVRVETLSFYVYRNPQGHVINAVLASRQPVINVITDKRVNIFNEAFYRAVDEDSKGKATYTLEHLSYAVSGENFLRHKHIRHIVDQWLPGIAQIVTQCFNINAINERVRQIVSKSCEFEDVALANADLVTGLRMIHDRGSLVPTDVMAAVSAAINVMFEEYPDDATILVAGTLGVNVTN